MGLRKLGCLAEALREGELARQTGFRLFGEPCGHGGREYAWGNRVHTYARASKIPGEGKCKTVQSSLRSGICSLAWLALELTKYKVVC